MCHSHLCQLKTGVIKKFPEAYSKHWIFQAILDVFSIRALSQRQQEHFTLSHGTD